MSRDTCSAEGPDIRNRIGGEVIATVTCDRPAGHTGPHRSGFHEWGEDE